MGLTKTDEKSSRVPIVMLISAALISLSEAAAQSGARPWSDYPEPPIEVFARSLVLPRPGTNTTKLLFFFLNDGVVNYCKILGDGRITKLPK